MNNSNFDENNLEILNLDKKKKVPGPYALYVQEKSVEMKRNDPQLGMNSIFKNLGYEWIVLFLTIMSLGKINEEIYKNGNTENVNKLELYKRIKNNFYQDYILSNDNFQEKLIFSLKCFDEFYKTFTNENKIFFSFNGGKDCLAAYIMIKFYFYCKDLNLNYEDQNSFISFCNFQNREKLNLSKYNIEFIYFLNNKNFSEEEDYVIQFTKNEKIKIYYLYTDYISGLKFMIKNFDLKLVIMGTRKDDLKNKIERSTEETLIHQSTPPYPTFTRFYPIFDFDFHDIWRLILITKYEYLNLYDLGYSSIGRKDNTHLNENLKIDENLYVPAWCLEEKMSERSFRK